MYWWDTMTKDNTICVKMLRRFYWCFLVVQERGPLQDFCRASNWLMSYRQPASWVRAGWPARPWRRLSFSGSLEPVETGFFVFLSFENRLVSHFWCRPCSWKKSTSLEHVMTFSFSTDRNVEIICSYVFLLLFLIVSWDSKEISINVLKVKRLQVYFIWITGKIRKSELYDYRGPFYWNNEED